ncbi:hypothetical protein [Streptomyces sp. NPDC048172]|uniref:hypothetical protein n=1 Tax=Streptomyces sp. NPDC048172 TaxID=3365505 RepID=UPI00371C4766
MTVKLPTAITGAPDDGPGEEPVFVDSSGGRRRLLRKLGWVVGVASLAYAVVLGISLAGGDAGAPDVLIPGPDKKASDKVEVDPSPSKSVTRSPEVVDDPTPTTPAETSPTAPAETPTTTAPTTDPGKPTVRPTSPKPTTSGGAVGGNGGTGGKPTDKPDPTDTDTGQPDPPDTNEPDPPDTEDPDKPGQAGGLAGGAAG